MSQVRILHQRDTYKGKLCGEFWMLDGLSYRDGLKRAGLIWVDGPDGGCWHIADNNVLSRWIKAGYPVIETGTDK